MTKLRKNILKYILELIIVAFGVFLGIYVSESRTKHLAKKKKETAISFILNELDENIKNLSQAIEYHETIRNNLNESTNHLDEKTIYSSYFSKTHFHITQIKGWRGLGLSKLDNIAFESAKLNSILQDVNISDLQLISNAYKQIEFLDKFGKSLFDKFINMDTSTKIIDVIGMLELLTTDILNSEKRLKEELTLIRKAIGNT